MVGVCWFRICVYLGLADFLVLRCGFVRVCRFGLGGLLDYADCACWWFMFA